MGFCFLFIDSDGSGDYGYANDDEVIDILLPLGTEWSIHG